MMTGQLEMDIHKGEAILQLAKKYATLKEVIEEIVQNAIDANATRIEVKVNWQSRNIIIRDNGDGVSKEDFKEALKSVAKSVKDETKLGKFGIGLISPLGKCDRFVFMSCPVGGAVYHRYTFVSSKIKACHNDVLVDADVVNQAYNANGIWWRSSITIERFTDDTITSGMTLDQLYEGINDKYTTTMLRKKVSVPIEFIDKAGHSSTKTAKGRPFHGTQLDDVTIVTDGSEPGVKHKTQFKMFLVRRQKNDKTKQVNIRFGEAGNDFRIVYKNFIRSSARDYLPEDLISALGLGMFEGEIISHDASILTERNAFELNDELVYGLCEAMVQWYEKHGKQHLNRVKRENKDARYHNLGVESMRCIHQWIDDMGYKSTIQGLFKKGTIGSNHTEHNGKETDLKYKSIHGGERPKSTEEEKPASKKRGRPSKKKPTESNERENHMPIVIEDPTGKKRIIVSKNSIGLSVVYDEPGPSRDLWRLDSVHGELTINITHPLFDLCDKADSYVRSLIEMVLREAILLEIWPDKSNYSHLRKFSDMSIEGSVIAMTNSNSGSHRVARSKKEKSK